MNLLLRLAYKLGLIEDRVAFRTLTPLPRDILYIPAGYRVEGQIHTELPVVVAGTMDGSINIRGDADLVILKEGSINNGLVSANFVDVSGSLRNAHIDVCRLFIHDTGKVLGRSQILYEKLGKHPDSQMDATSKKRVISRDGLIYLAKGQIDLIEPISDVRD